MTSALACYRDAVIALESFDNETEIAMESLGGDMKSIAEDLNPKLSDAAGRYAAAINSQDYDEALKVLGEIETIAKTWKSRLSALPAESMSKTILRTTIKVAAVLVSCFILMKSPAMKAFVIKWLKSHGASNFVSKAGAFAAIDMGIGGKAFSTIFSSISGIFMRITNSKNPNSAKYQDDPNRRNATYMAAQLGLDDWIIGVSTAKAEIRKLQSGKKEN